MPWYFSHLQWGGGKLGYHPFEVPTVCDFSSYRYRHHGKGDRSEVIKTEIYKKYKFPEFEGEKFCPEGLVWTRIAQDYEALYIPEMIYVKGAPNDSITANVYNHLRKNCKGTCLHYYEIITNPKCSYRFRFNCLIRYYRYALYAHFPIIKGIPLHLLVVGLPLGMITYLRDRFLYDRSIRV